MNENKLLEDLGEYLKSKGYDPVVIGFQGIGQTGLKHNFQLIVNFTGTKSDAYHAVGETGGKDD